MMLEVMVGVVYMQVDILVNMDVDKVADMVMKIPIEGFTDVTLVQGCRIVLGAWQQKICAWQKIAKNA